MASMARVNLRSIALPTEHGGWGFLIEPILLALLIAPSWQGLILAVAVVSLFLLHQPLKIAIKDNLKRRRVPRTQWAERFALLYGGLGISLILILTTFNGASFLLPMMVGSIFALVQVFYDGRNKSRNLIPELSGAIALAATASSMALLANWTLIPALILWLILSTRALTAIIYVRVRLRMAYGKPHNKHFALGLHIMALVIFTIFVFYDLMPVVTVLAMLILVIRAFKGILAPAPQVTPKIIGFTELAFGMIYVLVVSFGYW
ncbi:MAG: YwiC-like family protein [Anaerolineae bacterium]|nr:YwiC-like family protein [Anaerolineae bacterium]MDQ7034851.1 YwiC-like family protein [Anaerolineae bacterium]